MQQKTFLPEKIPGMPGHKAEGWQGERGFASAVLKKRR